MALGEEDPVALGVVVELREPAAVAAVVPVAPDDAPVPELHVLVHAGVGRIGDDDVDGLVVEAAQEADTVVLPDVVHHLRPTRTLVREL